MKKIAFFDWYIPTAIVLGWVIVIVGSFFVSQLPWPWQKERTLNILTWTGILDEKTIADFSRKTGMVLNVSYYTTNEELLSALKAGKSADYDLVVPSDYAVKILRDENLLKPIKKNRLTFINTINPLFLGYDFDPDNEYSLPYMWEIFGLGFSKHFFGQLLPDSWKWIFQDPKTFKIVMVNDSVEAVNLAAFYLYRFPDRPLPLLNDQQTENVRQLLIKQKEWVEAYTDFRPDYFLLSKDCPLVVTQFSNVLRGRKLSDDVGFKIPKEGTFISIENFAIPAGVRDEDAVYEFLNYLYTPAVMNHHFDELSSLPTTHILHDLDFDEELKKAILSLLGQSREEFKKQVLFFTPILSEKVLHQVWVDVKSR